MNVIKKWDQRLFDLAEFVSHWSKDPSTKCGCVITSPDRKKTSLGYNGFPTGIDDNPYLLNDREEKYKRIIHSEMNAILNAQFNLEGCTLYNYPFLPCNRCAPYIIQAGINKVITQRCPDEKKERWRDSFKLSEELFKEANVDLVYLR